MPRRSTPAIAGRPYAASHQRAADDGATNSFARTRPRRTATASILVMLAVLPLMAALIPGASAQGTAPMPDRRVGPGPAVTEGTASGGVIGPGTTSTAPGSLSTGSAGSDGSTQVPTGGRAGMFSGGGMTTSGTGGGGMAGSTMGGIAGASKGAVGGPGPVSGGTGDGTGVR